MEFGLFNSACVLPQFRGDEHRRIMDEVAIVQAADRVGFKYTWATEHHFLTEYSHLSANEVFLGYLAAATSRIHIGSGIFNITPPVNHPARVAERVAMLDHLVGGPLRVRHGPRLVDHRAARLRHRRSRPHQGHVRRGGRRVPQDVAGRGVPGLRRPVLLDAARATCCRSRTPRRTRRCGSRPATRRRSRRPRAWGSACCASRWAGPRRSSRSSRSTRTRSQNAEPVGDFVNDNIMVTTQLLCLEDGQRARDSAPTSTWATTAACCSVISTRSRARRASPNGRSCCPSRRRDDIDAAIAAGDIGVRHARRGRGRDPQVRRRRRRPGRVRAAVVDRWNATSRSRRSRRSASTCCPRSTPIRCTARPANARRRAVALTSARRIAHYDPTTRRQAARWARRIASHRPSPLRPRLPSSRCCSERAARAVTRRRLRARRRRPPGTCRCRVTRA